MIQMRMHLNPIQCIWNYDIPQLASIMIIIIHHINITSMNTVPNNMIYSRYYSNRQFPVRMADVPTNHPNRLFSSQLPRMHFARLHWFWQMFPGIMCDVSSQNGNHLHDSLLVLADQFYCQRPFWLDSVLCRTPPIHSAMIPFSGKYFVWPRRRLISRLGHLCGIRESMSN